MNASQKILGLLALLGASGSPLLAQSVWSGGAGNWSSNTNPGWNGTGVPNAIDATANINSGTGTITVDGTYILGTLTSAATRNLGISSGGTLVFDVSSGSALFDLTNGLTSGTGTIGGFSTYSTNLQLNDNTEIRGLVSTSSAAPIFSGKISGSGALLLTNVATTPTGGGLRVDLRNSTSDFSGGVNIGNGVALRLNASGAAGSGTITLADTTSGGNQLDFRVDASNPTQVHQNAVNFGTRSSGSATIFSLQNNTMSVTLNGVLSGTMGSTGRANLNGGTLILGGTEANTWTGQFRSDTHGTIIADKVGAINNGFQMRSQVTDSTMAVLFGVSDTITGQVSVDGNNSGAGFAYQARLGLKDGNNGTVTLNNANKINLANAWGIGGTSATATTTSLNLHSGNGTGTLAVTTEIGQNTDARSISITGTGTVNLNRAAGNTYTGATSVLGGTLLASNTSGSATGSGAVTVSSGATLGGTGIITGATTVNGRLQAGASAIDTAALTFSGNLTMGSGSVVSLGLGATATARDQLVRSGSGTWTFQSNQAFTFVDQGAVAGITYTDIITNLAGDPNVSGWTVTNAGWTGFFTFDGANVDFTLSSISVVPEPSSFAALAGAIILGAVGFRRRRTA